MESGNTSGIIRGIENIKNLMINATSKSLPAVRYEQPDGLYEYKKQDYKYRSKCNQECF
jgi:hypothetical protein